MAVGSRFTDPATQAALQAQLGGTQAQEPAQEPAPEPAPEPVKVPAPEQTQVKESAPEPTKDPAPEPEPTEQPEPTEADVNLNITPTEPKEPAPDATKEEPVEAPDMDMSDVDTVLKDTGFTVDSIAQATLKNDGKVPTSIINKLKETIDPALVDANVKRLEAELKIAQINKAEAEGKVKDLNDFIYGSLADGDVEQGTKNWETLSAWAKENMPKEDLEAVNIMLRSGNKSVIKQGLKLAVTQWRGAQEPTMMTGDKGKETPREEFKPLSKAEFKQIMKSEKYNTDPDYAAEIDNRRRKTMENEQWLPPGHYR